MDQDLMILKVGETGSITATISPANATNKKVNWSSSDENVAIVDENGKVTAVAGGTATITVTSVADPTKKATKQVIVGDLLVPAGGNIKEVIDNAENGNVIALAPATYDIGASRIIIDKGISLIGAGYDKTIIKGTVHRAGTPANDIVQPMLLTISKTGETLIKGIGFEWVDADDIGNNSYSALSLAGDNVTVTECKISTNIPATNYITIVNIGRSGGNVPGEAGVAAQNITFTNNIMEGTISIVPSVSNIPLKATVAGNTIEAVNMEGIWTYSLNDKDELVIEDNHISGVPDGMYDIKLMERVKSVNGNEEYTDKEISEANNNSSVLLQYMTRFVGQGVDVANHKYSTIEEALNAANEGDLILVTGEVDGFTVNKPVAIRGGTINSRDLPATSGNVGVYIPAGVKGIVLEDVQIVGTTDAKIGIETGANVELTVKNSEISGFTTGIYLNPGSVLTATNNIISDVVAGIGSDKANLTGDVSGNTFNNCTSEGIGLYLPIKADGTVMSKQEAETLAAQLKQANTFQDCGDPPVKIYGEPQEETNVEGLDASGKRVGFFETVSDALADETVATIKVYPGDHGKDPIAIVQREGVNITLEAVGDVVLKNQILIYGSTRSDGDETLTIKGFTFDLAGANDNIDIISAPDRLPDNNYSYAHNIKIENNTFIGNPEVDVVAIRAAAKGGHTNFAIKNCTGEDLHSLAQLTSVNGVTVKDCSVSGGKSGINLQNSTDITITNFTVDGTGPESYGVRAGQGSGTNESTLTISNSELKAQYPIWLRGGAPETVTITNSTLVHTEGGERIKNDAGVNVLEDPTVYNKGLETYYMTIQEAIDAAVVGENIIEVYPRDYGTDSIKIIQEEGVNITLEAVGEVELKNQIRIDGDGRSKGEESLTIKGFTFDFTDATDATGVVDIISTTNDDILTGKSYNYSHNVTIEDCTFIGNKDNNKTVVAVRAAAKGGHTKFCL
ncbi:MAG: Ig-like domain-containing protein [Anaerovoracaceae bacterium]